MNLGRLAIFPATLICTAALGVNAAAQHASVSGILTNSLNGAPVADALVRLEGPATLEGKSGPDGRFSISDVPPGAYHVIIRASGYLASRSELVVAGAGQSVDIRLDPELHYTEVLSVSPNGRDQFDAYQPTNVLGGQELTKQLQSTLGATVEAQPGMAQRSFGPGPARPVIRGLDGDRVLILEDGQRMGDLSSQSGDHGVNVNPASASRIEVVRGPATLLYGANAIGGLVNVVTADIPRSPVTRPTGGVTLDFGSAAREAGSAGDVTVGKGALALHVGGSGRRSSDYETASGRIPNSFTRAAQGQVGLAYTTDQGFVGGSYGYDRSHYGVPFVEEGETNLDPRRHTMNFRAERRNLGLFETLRGAAGIRRYRHDERDGETVATEFTNNTVEFDVLGTHRALGRLKGSVGGTVVTRAFSTAGEEALSPAVDQRGIAAYLYEEVELTPHATFQFGARVDRTTFDPDDGRGREFTNVSGSVGLVLHPSDATTLAFSLARASRNPALEELYFHGAHPGNFAFENGNATLESEHALGFDASFRWRGAAVSGEATYFINRVSDFIFREYTGAIVDDLPETFFTQGDARLQGVESHVDVHVTELWAVEAGLDYVRGDLTARDLPLPRMPPLRARAGIRFQRNAFQAGIDGLFTGRQDRVYTAAGQTGTVGETPTEGYNLVKLYSAYSFGGTTTVHTITVRLDNLTNEQYRNHLNYLKDLAPEIGRNLRVVYAFKF